MRIQNGKTIQRNEKHCLITFFSSGDFLFFVAAFLQVFIQNVAMSYTKQVLSAAQNLTINALWPSHQGFHHNFQCSKVIYNWSDVRNNTIETKRSGQKQLDNAHWNFLLIVDDKHFTSNKSEKKHFQSIKFKYYIDRVRFPVLSKVSLGYYSYSLLIWL